MKRNIIIVLVLAVVVFGGWRYASSQKMAKDAAMMEERAASEKMAAEKAAAEQEVMMKKEDAMPAADTAMAKKEADDAMMKKESGAAMMVKGGAYVSYDAAKLAFAKEGKVVLFFRASWCPTCRALDSDIRANLGKIPENVLILDVDYDRSADLKKRYGVTYQHTLVQVDASGDMIAKWSGSAGLSELLEQVK